MRCLLPPTHHYRHTMNEHSYTGNSSHCTLHLHSIRCMYTIKVSKKKPTNFVRLLSKQDVLHARVDRSFR